MKFIRTSITNDVGEVRLKPQMLPATAGKKQAHHEVDACQAHQEVRLQNSWKIEDVILYNTVVKKRGR
jgi:thiazole synthase ThiGH ThiG subunit